MWYANKKAWMTSNIFLDWLKAFDRHMKAQGRNVLLFFDNPLSHPMDFRSSNVKVVFLPFNITSLLQPLDQGDHCCNKEELSKTFTEGCPYTNGQRRRYFEDQQLCHRIGCLLIDT